MEESGESVVEVTAATVEDGPVDEEDPVWLPLDCVSNVVPVGPALDPALALAELGTAAADDVEEEFGPPVEEEVVAEEVTEEAPFAAASPVLCQ